MTLSKKNIDKLKSLSPDNSSIRKIKNKTMAKSSNLKKPSDIFYSIIDNANDLNETILVNEKLKESELICPTYNDNKFNSKDNKNYKNISFELSEEELLYDEFNYLLDE